MREKNNNREYSVKAFRIMVVGMIIMLFITILSAVIFFFIMNRLEFTEKRETASFSGHYVYICENDEGDFWKEVYEAACEEAKDSQIYVEYLKDSMGVNYSNEDLFRVAINSGADGIIYGGNVDESIIKMVNKAVDEGIVVVLLQNDADSSRRQCFVGVNNYELGQVYAGQIAEMFVPSEFANKKVDVLVNSDMTEGAANVFTIAIEDFFSERYPESSCPEINIVRIDTQDVFSVEEDIRNYIFSDDLPDAVLCLSSTYTQCAYQALIDLNKVGDTQIVGYFVNDTILDAISRQLIYSTISVDTEQMGKNCIISIKEYLEEGYTNSYISVSTSVIGQKEARRMIDDEAKNNE